MLRKMFFVSVAILAVVAISLTSCKGGKKDANDSSSNTDKESESYLSYLTKDKGGDFRGYTINQTTLDDVKKNEDASALYTDKPEQLGYKYQIDDYNRYDASFFFSEGKLNLMVIDYYSYDNDGDKAYNNGKVIYDELFKKFNVNGDAKKYAEDNYNWETKSIGGDDIVISLANKGQKGSSGTVSISFKLK